MRASSIELIHKVNPCHKCNYCQRVSKRRWSRHATEWNKAHTSKLRRVNYLYTLVNGLEHPTTFEGYKGMSVEEAMKKVKTNKDATKIQATVRMWIRHVENKRLYQEQMEWRRLQEEQMDWLARGLNIPVFEGHPFLARPRVVNTRVIYGYYELMDNELGI